MIFNYISVPLQTACGARIVLLAIGDGQVCCAWRVRKVQQIKNKSSNRIIRLRYKELLVGNEPSKSNQRKN